MAVDDYAFMLDILYSSYRCRSFLILCDMGHCIATLCKGQSETDMDQYDNLVLLAENNAENMNVPGLDANKRVDAVISQGVEGAHAMDKLMRDCLQCEPGARMHVCVAYTLLRVEVMRNAITMKERVFMPDHMILFVEPAPVPAICVSHGMSHAYMRVRVFRFLLIPTGVSRDSAKRKAGNVSSDDEDHTHTSDKVFPSSMRNKTLRHRIL